MNRTTLHKHLCRIFLMIICCVGVPCKASILCTHPNNPYAVTHILDAYGAHYDFRWDANGNLTDSRAYATHTDRRLCWTEDCCGPRPCGANRLQAFMERGDEGGIAAYYNYSAEGERNIKLTSPRLNIQQNASLFSNPPLVYPTLYASSLVTLTKQGYTNVTEVESRASSLALPRCSNVTERKHYFEEGRRICSKIGGGMQGNVTAEEIDSRVPELAYNYDEQYHNQYDGIRQTFHDCIEADPQIIDGVNLHHMLVEREVQRDEDEPTFFYHGDHLGSAAYLTYHGGVIQTLNYLPYGEDWVEYNFFHSDDTTRLGIYRFNGKEKDYESGFHYYGARYYWSEVLTGWLSVDPMMDEYPGLSPYNYCIWNPAKLNDPNGEDPVFFGLLQYQGIAKYGNSHLGETQQIGNFQVTPFYDNNNNLLGYNAGRYRSDGSFVNEYQMEPGDIKMFSQNVKTYEDAANLVYCAGEPDWSYVAFGSYLTTGNYHAALSELGKMWGNALSSPSFYIASTLSVLSMSKTSSVKQILRDIRNIESSGGYVKINPLNPRNNQKINMTIGNSSRKIDLRIESHPLPKKLGGNGVSPQPHMNVDYYENGVKIKTYHIILEQ